MTRFPVNKLLLSAVLCLAAGCVVGPDYSRPGLPFDLGTFAASQDQEAAQDHIEMQAVQSGLADIHSWWANLNDPLLVELLSRACQENPGLLEAGSRIVQTQAQREFVVGSLWPQYSTDIGYSHRRIAPQNSGQIGQSSGDRFDSYTTDFRATWEIDLFGRIQRSIEAADARSQVEEENYRDVLISLLADIATNYVELRVLQNRRTIAKDNLAVQSKNLKLAEVRNKAGLVGLLDVKQAENTIRLTEATVPVLDEQIRQRLNRLSTLMGRPPTQDFYAYIGNGPVPMPVVGINSGIPAQLVSQRPDIRRAEREIHAANADVGVAVADLYPQVSLLGNPSFDSSLFREWYSLQSFGFSVGPSLRWNIFTMGRTLNQIEAQKAARQQAELRFRNAVLLAVEEVDSGLVSYRKAKERTVSLKKASEAAEEAVGLSESTYQVGNNTFQRVVDAQRQLLQSEDQLASAQGDIVLAWIRTYRALGGGWRNSPAAAGGQLTGIEVRGHTGGFGTVGVESALPQPAFGEPAPQHVKPPSLLPGDPAPGRPVTGGPPVPPSGDTGRSLPILDELHQAPLPSAPWASNKPAAPLRPQGQQQPTQAAKPVWGNNAVPSTATPPPATPSWSVLPGDPTPPPATPQLQPGVPWGSGTK